MRTSPVSNAANQASLLQVTQSGGGRATAASPVPLLISSTPAHGAAGVATGVVIELEFNQAMAAGSGAIYLSDGATQTVIDRATQLPVQRIVGATDLRAISLSSGDVIVSGNRVTIRLDEPLKAGLEYNVQMAPGVLTSSANVPFAGLADSLKLRFTPAAGDVSGPVVTSFTLDSDSLKSGSAVNLAITFSEAVTGVSAAGFTVPNGTLENLSTTDHLTWTAVLTPPALGIVDATNVITFDAASVRDLAGNAGSGSVSFPNYQVDTMVGTYVGSMIFVDDAGPYEDDYITNVLDQEIVGILSNPLASGESFALTVNGVPAASSDITIYEGTVWTYLPATSANFHTGTNTIVAKVVGVDGHSSTAVTQSFTIETVVPELVSAPTGTGIDVNAALVLTFSEAMYWESESESDSTKLELEDSDGNIRLLPSDSSWFSSDRTTLTIPASAHQLYTGTGYQVFLPSNLTDLAGNAPSEPSIRFTTSGVHTDHTPPSADRATASVNDGEYGIGSVIDIAMHFNEDVYLGAPPALQLSSGGVASYHSGDGSNTLVFRYTVAAGDLAQDVGISDAGSMAGKVRDLAGNVLDTAHITFAGLLNPQGYGSNIDIDGVAPAAPGAAPVLDPASDSDLAGDLRTTDTTPALSGTGALPSHGIKLYDGGTLVGSTVSGSSGAWSITASALAVGAHSLTVKQFDTAGNPSAASAALALVIDDDMPSVVSGRFDIQSGMFMLSFDENIVFQSGGTLHLYNQSNVLVNTYTAADTDKWSILSGDYGRTSVLGLWPEVASGQYELRMAPNTLADTTGNVSTELVGTASSPGFTFTVTLV